MINDVLVFLKDNLNAQFELGATTHGDEKVGFPGGSEKSHDAHPLASQKVNVLLINLEQDNILRSPDRFVRVSSDGTPHKVFPEIRLNLMVLFVANFTTYLDDLTSLSKVIQYFQRYPLFTQHNSLTLDPKIDQIIVELVTPSISEQNDIWSSLRLPYHPSVLYKVKTVIFQDEVPQPIPQITQIDTTLINEMSDNVQP